MVKAYSPRLASFSLAHLSSLSDEPALILSVSERTFYVLLNLVTADILDEKRWAVEYLPSGYVSVKPGDPEYQTMLDAVEGLEREVYDLSDQLIDLLAGIEKRLVPTNVVTKLSSQIVVVGGTYLQYLPEVPAGEFWRLSVISTRLAGSCVGCFHGLQRFVGGDVQWLSGNLANVAYPDFAITRPDTWLAGLDRVLIYWTELSVGAQVDASISADVWLPVDEE